MKRLIRQAEIHDTVEIGGKQVEIYNNPVNQEAKDIINISPNSSVNGLMTNTDIYIWSSEFSGNQIKSYIRDNFDIGYQFSTTGNSKIKIFKNGPIREDEIKTTLNMYYGYLLNIIDTVNSELTIENYVDGDGTQDPSYTINFNDFLNR